ncbi:MAG TPA: YciI family protein [Dyella sp.]|uniref:YciI family protein n=1 Tax=Dyella sp. TaxID=1869338 RepID=UPI002F93A3F8
MNRYLVLAMRRPHFDPDAASAHQAFLQGLRNGGTLELSGPFTDKSGGAYIIRAESIDAARTIVQQDPVHTSGGWDVTLHEWDAR